MAIIYGVPASPFVRKVILAHAVKGIEYKLKITMPGSDDATFRQASPLGKVPGYQTDDGFSFSDSAVIVAYLERVNHGVKLYPQDNHQYAHALWLERYADTRLMEATGALYMQVVLGPKYFGKPIDEAKVAQVSNEVIPKELDYLESQMTDGWVAGDSLSIADIAIVSNLFNLVHAQFDLDISKWPKLSAYFARITQLEVFSQQLMTEQQAFAKAG